MNASFNWDFSGDFRQPDRFFIRMDAYGKAPVVAQRAEEIIACARELILSGDITSDSQLEEYVARQYFGLILTRNSPDWQTRPIRRLEWLGLKILEDPVSGEYYKDMKAALGGKHEPYRPRVEKLLGRDGEHMMKAHVGGQLVELVKTKVVTVKTEDVEYSYTAWLPPMNPETMSLVERHTSILFDDLRALAQQQGQQPDLIGMLAIAAESEWFSAQSWKYVTGSAGIGQLKVRAMLEAAGVYTGRYRQGLDPNLEALVTPLAQCIVNYPSFFETPPRHF